ncbi:uncharacterized protein LOC131163002 isoform X7 [Malania oleifera]|uniref:uncharacterized protein LOC131163002 isoform X7 n=1 Tax=Malania oleifera TaxID=397392 RepID=UPI0025ADAE7D|nr:uncharacterized protein LOC131163002 isoform X7 [Malania oleifera]
MSFRSSKLLHLQSLIARALKSKAKDSAASKASAVTSQTKDSTLLQFGSSLGVPSSSTASHSAELSAKSPHNASLSNKNYLRNAIDSATRSLETDSPTGFGKSGDGLVLWTCGICAVFMGILDGKKCVYLFWEEEFWYSALGLDSILLFLSIFVTGGFKGVPSLDLQRDQELVFYFDCFLACFGLFFLYEDLFSSLYILSFNRDS